MREYLTKEETVTFCKALSSELRVDMLQYIYKHKGVSLIDLADTLGVSRAAITQNMKILTEADLWRSNRSAVSGMPAKPAF